MRYDVEVTVTSLAPLQVTVATLADAMRFVEARVTVSDSHNVGATMIVEAGDLPEAINTGLDAWLAALRSTGDGASAMSISASRAE